MKGPILHIGGLFAPSSGLIRVKCGRKVSYEAISVLGRRRPNGWRECKTCRKYHDARMILLGCAKPKK